MDLTAKNTEAFKAAIDELNERCAALVNSVAAQEGALRAALSRMAALEEMVLIQRASSIGRGPTVRS